MTRKLPVLALLLSFCLLVGASLGYLLWYRPSAQPPIRIGVLHSLTGTMSTSERPLVEAVRLAVDEINAQGGLLGRPVVVVVVDGRSDWQVFAQETERLIQQEQVSALFACWTSACRKAIKPVVERHQHLLFYPVQYEGLEQSKYIVYTGAAPNQQIVPGTHWALTNFGKRIYLVGSDYVFPRIANRIISDLIHAAGGQILGERYIPLGSTDIQASIDDIRRLRPDIVLNTLNGDSNAPFFQALSRAADLHATPVLSFSVAEPEMISFGGGALPAHYAVWSYFQSLPGAENRRFVTAFQARYGRTAVTSDPMVAAYVGVHLWAQAVREAGSAEPARVNATIAHQSYKGPFGIVSVDPSTRHVWRSVRIGRVLANGQFELVDALPSPIRPAPFPVYRAPLEWQAITTELSGPRS